MEPEIAAGFGNTLRPQSEQSYWGLVFLSFKEAVALPRAERNSDRQNLMGGPAQKLQIATCRTRDGKRLVGWQQPLGEPGVGEMASTVRSEAWLWVLK